MGSGINDSGVCVVWSVKGGAAYRELVLNNNINNRE